MLVTVEKFEMEMNKIIHFVHLIKAAQELAGHGYGPIRGRKLLLDTIEKLVHYTRELGTAGHHYDGAYLSACALFELSIRDLIEKYVSCVNDEVPTYNQVPQKMREWHITGNAYLLSNIGMEKFKHINKRHILECLSSCLKPSRRKPYKFNMEAFSYHGNNMKSSVINDILNSRIGLNDIWGKVSRLPEMLEYIGSENNETVHRVLTERLDKIIKRRNDIIHRGREYYTAGETEVIEAASLFREIIKAIAGRMRAQLDAI